MNRFGSNSYDNESDQFAQNQQIGRQLHENSPRPWNESGRPHHVGNRHGHSPNYRPDAVNDIRYHNDYTQRNEYGGRGGENPNMPYYPQDEAQRHHDTSIWTERNAYKDNDYRYRSGHRNYWHEDYDEKYEGRHHHPHPQNFFANIGQGLREGWNNLVHGRHDDDRYEDEYRRNKRPYNPYDSYRLNQGDNRYNRPEERDNPMQSRTNPQSNEWKNSGPDHRDEDFFDSRNFKL